jgi:replicative DNA helicase
MGGIEPNVIYTIAGISGSGKSSFVNSLETDLFDENPKANIAILNFSFEMVSARQVGRKLSYRLKKTTKDLYSGDIKNPLNDQDFSNVEQTIKEIKKYPIYYVDTPGTVAQIRQTIFNFMNNEGKGKWVIIILDHTLLAKSNLGEDERIMLANLQRMFIEIKKYGLNTIIQLSQLNRNIESSDRISNHSMHYPMRKDIFGADSLFQASDYLLVIHRPEIIGIEAYGLEALPTKGLIYLHFLKNREGDIGIIPFINNLQYNRIDETVIKKPNDELEKNNLKINI